MKTLHLVLALVLMSAAAGAQGGRGFTPGPPPDVSGKWSGTWSAYNPAQGATPPKEQCKTLTADITREGGFPPLLLDPVDFGALYMRKKQLGMPPQAGPSTSLS